jgi:glycerol-3-phosphate dehydrogenase (NAD(P)+)
MSQTKSRVLIIGYGEMGHAMECLLTDAHQLAIHDSRAIEGLAPIDVEHEAASADFVLLCVPAFPHQELLTRLAPLIREQCICLSIAKGLDDQGRTPAQVYAQVFSGRGRHTLLYGPMISEEIRAGRLAFAELGCTDIADYHAVRNLYRGTSLYIRPSTDITGISWSVILKNVYAIGFGIADGLQLGDNMRGYLAVTALAELSAIVGQMGGLASTPLQLAGLGDLITTATSAGSHHHELGCMLARGQIKGISGEGVHTLAMVEKYALFDAASYPLYRLIQEIVKAPVDVAGKVHEYLSCVYP